MQQRTTALHTPCWTELSVPDPQAAKDFYGTVLGWQAQTDPRPEAAGYAMFLLEHSPMAAVCPMYDDATPVAWSVCLSVKDAERTALKAVEQGGTILTPPVDVFDLGRYAVLSDPDGASFAIWQAHRFSGADIIGDPDSLGWIELSTANPQRALSFYPAVFGWTTHLSDFYTEWSIGGTRFGGLADLNRMPAPAGEAPAHWKPYFRVPDVDAVTARAAGEGAAVLLAPAAVPGGDLRISILKDPQGAQFGVFAPAQAGPRRAARGSGS